MFKSRSSSPRPGADSPGSAQPAPDVDAVADVVKPEPAPDVKMEEGSVDSRSRSTSVKPEPGAIVKVDAAAEGAASASPAPPVKPAKAGPLLIGHLPVATEAAMATFTELPGNHYQYGTLGLSRESIEGMICDCQYDHGEDEDWVACGNGSDCINRLTQVECLADECRCRRHCQNQRFQRREFAPIEIVQTEKKGFGLRAKADLYKDQFIYEYIGDVVSHPSFMKRMRDYAGEGIKHFYFMMLQREEYIDATKRGGIGRFANHSCNPNCYVAKWTVGHHVRMGIFAHRKIKKDEELTFNYNVDRYGHDAQPCYCGEPKCVGWLGGKTQTDIGGMDDLYLDALGITDEVERLGLKGSKKRKGKKLDEDYMPTLNPLLEKDVPKVLQAVRQTQSRKVLFKLLTRIKITEEHGPLRQLMRLRGFGMMKNVMDDYTDDAEIGFLAMECMKSWPLLQRNKVEDSKITVPVDAWTKSEDEKIRTLAQELISHWATLETAYRIPKRIKADGTEEDDPTAAPVRFDDLGIQRPAKRFRVADDRYETGELKLAPVVAPVPLTSKVLSGVVLSVPETTSKRQTINALIAKVAADAAAAEEAKAAAASSAAAEAERAAAAKQRREARKLKPKATAEERELLKAKRLEKLVGAVVVKCMSKHKNDMDHDLFKKHAKELTKLIADKEKKSSAYKEGKLDSLSDEKVFKIKKFAKEYIAKVLRNLQKGRSGSGKSKGGLAPPTDSANTSVTGASTSTPDSRDDIDIDIGDDDDAMDVDSDGDGADAEEPSPVTPSPSVDIAGSMLVEPGASRPADPREREAGLGGWEPDEEPKPAGAAAAASQIAVL